MPWHKPVETHALSRTTTTQWLELIAAVLDNALRSNRDGPSGIWGKKDD